MGYWNSDPKYKIERWYETYLMSLKYILGYSSEVFKLAEQFKNDGNIDCQEAS